MDNCNKCIHFKICEKAKHVENYKLNGECSDFMELVRCKECVHRSTDDFYSYYCGLQDVECEDNDFCSYGQRR